MRRVVLIACSKKKLKKRAKAKELYTSLLSVLNMRYSKHIKAEEVYILSAKHGLLELDEEIDPYDITLNKMSVEEKKEWSQLVLETLTKKEDVNTTCFIFLAGENYRRYLLPRITHFTIPLKGLAIGKQLQYLKEEVDA